MREGVSLQGSKLLRRKQQAGDRGGPESTARNRGLSHESPSPHSTFCSYCCFIDRKCWSHCLFTSSSCGERRVSRRRAVKAQGGTTWHSPAAHGARGACGRPAATDALLPTLPPWRLGAPRGGSSILAREAGLTQRAAHNLGAQVHDTRATWDRAGKLPAPIFLNPENESWRSTCVSVWWYTRTGWPSQQRG